MTPTNTDISTPHKKITIGITGASGIIYGIRLLEVLKEMPNVETHLVMTKPAVMTLAYESDMTAADVKALADHYHGEQDFAAPISSGSHKMDGMIIAPCSVNCLGEIANGITTSLVSRAADVMLKEQRKLVLMVRETPLHQGHLKNLVRASENGAIIAPPVPAFYIKPTSIDDLINHSVGRVLDLFDIDANIVNRWRSNDDKD